MMISGSCLCGAVSYKTDGDISPIVHCHCAICRKTAGSAFASVASVPVDDLLLTGEVHLSCYESSPGKKRYFCRHCGTPVYSRRDGKPNVALRLGSLDTGIPREEYAHIWLSNSASWHDLDADLLRLNEGLRGR